MHYVYILISDKDRELYIGQTCDLKQRYAEHLSGKVKSTKNRLPLKLIYYECFENVQDAKSREIFLKGGEGHRQIKIQLVRSLKSNNYKHI